MTKRELKAELQRHAVSLNAAGEQLFAPGKFTNVPTRTSVTTVELTVANLGFPCGAVVADIYAYAATLKQFAKSVSHRGHSEHEANVLYSVASVLAVAQSLGKGL